MTLLGTMRRMASERTPRYSPTKNSRIVAVLAGLAASVLCAVHQLWPAVILAALILSGGIYRAIRHTQRHHPANRGSPAGCRGPGTRSP